MSDKPTDRIVVVLGPTAGGKSELAVRIAQSLDGEVISADSMQVYRHLDAGTAKPTRKQRNAVPHWLVDIVEPTETFTVADWLMRAEGAVAELHRRGKLPVVVGGTNLYIKALLEGMFDGPPGDKAYRTTLAERTPAELHAQLKDVDPEAADRIHPNDRKRLTRALEVFHATGKPISQQQVQWTDPREGGQTAYRHRAILIGLDWPTEAINKRINQRVRRMFSPTDGSEDLVSETRRLLEAGLLGEQARQALGTRQVLAHLAGEYDADRAFEKVKIETRRFAKNQRTWLRRFEQIHWLAACEQSIDDLAAEAGRMIRQAMAQ